LGKKPEYSPNTRRKRSLNICIVGPPGIGREVQSKMLRKAYGHKVISVGKILREEIGSQTEFGKMVSQYVKKRILIPDNILTEIVAQRMRGIQDGWVLDGFPMSINQMKLLSKEGFIVDIYAVIDISNQEYENTVLQRQYDPATKKLYHPKFSPAPPGVNKRLVRRTQDSRAALLGAKHTIREFYRTLQDNPLMKKVIKVKYYPEPKAVFQQIFERISIIHKRRRERRKPKQTKALPIGKEHHMPAILSPVRRAGASNTSKVGGKTVFTFNQQPSKMDDKLELVSLVRKNSSSSNNNNNILSNSPTNKSQTKKKPAGSPIRKITSSPQISLETIKQGNPISNSVDSEVKIEPFATPSGMPPLHPVPEGESKFFKYRVSPKRMSPRSVSTNNTSIVLTCTIGKRQSHATHYLPSVKQVEEVLSLLSSFCKESDRKTKRSTPIQPPTPPSASPELVPVIRKNKRQTTGFFTVRKSGEGRQFLSRHQLSADNGFWWL